MHSAQPGPGRPSFSSWKIAAGFLLAGFMVPADHALGQFPAEVRGVVVERESGTALSGALVEVPGSARSMVTDATGAFRLIGLEPGQHGVVVRRPGFEPWSADVELSNGRVEWLRVALDRAALRVDGVVVTGRSSDGGSVRMGRAEIQRSGARTIGEIVKAVPGAVIREDGPGGGQTISIRGSGADAVLVLLDGVPINDPVTGEADLSTIPAASIESVTVLVGAQGARYGPRAEAGVVSIETRAPAGGAGVTAGYGSLDERSVAGEGYASLGTISVGGGASLREMDGEFDYPRVPGIDETVEHRFNADVAMAATFATVRAPLVGGEMQGRAGVERLERGIPGRGYAPSPDARQEMERVRGSLGWSRDTGASSSSLAVSAVSQRVRYLDPAPPFGLPYDDVTRVRSVEVRGELGRAGIGRLRGWGGGLEAQHQRIDASALAITAPRYRTDAGAFLHAALGSSVGPWDAELVLEARLDRDGIEGELYSNRGVTLRFTGPHAQLLLTNRSGYSPPSLGDQFFREGVAIAPNPELRAERIPSEWEISGSLARSIGPFESSAGARLYQGDVHGMIVWLPDFRFVWSPRNSDVKRRGAEAWGEITHTATGLHATASYALARITYDRSSDDDVQVVYRPRHMAGLAVGWENRGWFASVDARFTGTRYPAPATLNPLESFWTIDLDMGHEWRWGRSSLDTAVHIDRLFNEKDSLIFGFPEPGRRIRLEARVRTAESQQPAGGMK